MAALLVVAIGHAMSPPRALSCEKIHPFHYVPLFLGRDTSRQFSPTPGAAGTTPANCISNNGADEETRTLTHFCTAPSRQRVYQFHHDGIIEAQFYCGITSEFVAAQVFARPYLPGFRPAREPVQELRWLRRL